MAKKKSWVDDNHYRTVSDDKKTSYLFKYGDLGDTCVEVSKHYSDGTTKAFTPGIISELGDKK